MSAHSFDVTFENFADSVLEASKEVPILVDFWASWCGPCKALMPVVEKLAEAYQGKFRLAKVNIDEQQQLATQFGVRSVPTVKLVRDGQVVDEFLGTQPESAIRAILDKHIVRQSDQQMAAAITLYQQGDKKTALEQMKAAVNSDPDNTRIRIQLAEILINENQTSEASAILNALPFDVQQDGHVAALMARVEFADTAANAPDLDTLKQKINQDPKDSDSRYLLATLLVGKGEHQAALDQFLELIRRDRSFKDDAGRKGMLKVFEMLGPNHALVGAYRKKMMAVLY